ncbi:uncharacterized protein LOC120556999 isoform X4 [Perca fluviatilis]|uniref:uncharacterized protein LOC120556999 isoform X4 n=1 Tax=Perca fluviatilis TaxID=8168 RepID=UPI0019637403|nr:uncharacterized protein LOC120556999 isoform X4 [Perca fluviatilis]
MSALFQPSIRPAPERTTNLSPQPAEREKEDAKGRAKEVQAKVLEEEKESQPVEKVQEEEEVSEGKKDEEEEEVVEMIHVVASDNEQKGEAMELVGSSLFPPSVSLPPSHLDNIVDKHLGDFSSEIQLLLQEQSINYSFPQSPHSISNTQAPAPQHTPPHTLISQFSQYVSFYNPCPPVQDYVSSLQDSIEGILTEFDESWPSHKAGTSRTVVDDALASRVSDFVSSIRAANAKTGRDDDGLCGEVTAADVGDSVSQSPALSRGGEVWQPHTLTIQVPNAPNNRNPSMSHVTLSTSASGSIYKPTDATVLIPPINKSPQSHWNPQQSHTLEITRTVTHNVRQTQDNSAARTVHCTTGGEGRSSLAGTNSEVTLPGFSGVSKPLTEASRPSEPLSSPPCASVPGPGTGPAPPAMALSSLISQLQPEVFTSLVEIIKDVKRNSLQFYLHSPEPGDQVHEEVKEYLLKQGNMEQSPVTFLSQETSDDRLLVIIKNKDIAGHVHKIPGLVSLKRHASVVFVGIDTLDDIRNNSYNELFVSGGCIVSDELVLNPDFITHDRLAALLLILEQHSSPESVWRWKVHCKTHKKLKEQARFRRDAANLLNVLSAYHKRQIVEFLPYHQCDMMNHQSPDLDCLMELQARYTQYRHTVFLTEHHFDKFAAYASSGIIMANIEEFLHDFTRLVGYHEMKDRQPIIDDMLAPKGLGRQPSHSDAESGSERSPSIFPEHIHPLCSSDQPQHLLQQSGSIVPAPSSSLCDQLVPDASCKEGAPHHSDTDFEVLRLAISHLRAERQAQLQQQLDSEAELSINSLRSSPPYLIGTGSGHTTPLLAQGGPTESVNVTHDRKAVAATLELIHSALQQEPAGEQRRKDGAETPTEGRTIGGSQGAGDQREGTPVRALGLLGENRGPSNSDTSSPSSNQSTAVVMAPSTQTDSTDDGREKANQKEEPVFPKTDKHAAASSSTTARPVEGDITRDKPAGQEQPRGEAAPPGTITVSGTKIQQPQQLLQHLNNRQQLQPSRSHLQPPPHSQQQQWGASLLQPHHLHRLPNQPFSRGPMLGPLTALGGGLLGPVPVWPGGLGPAGAAALAWGFQQVGRDFTGPRLLGGFHNPAGQGSRYRGGQRGGGFNGM